MANKIKNIKVRLTSIQYEELLKEYNKTLYSSLSEYIRVLVLDKVIITSDYNKEELIQQKERNRQMKNIFFQISKIGNNINQIAKLANQKKSIDTEELKKLNKNIELITDFLETNIRKNQ